MLLILIISFTLNSVTKPISFQTLSNAAYTGYQPNYQVMIEPKDIGEITVFSCSGRFSNWGLGFSNMHENSERRNWGSIAYHVKKIPFSIGFNGGVIKIYDQTDPLFDLGAWYHGKVSLGASFSNILKDDKILRGGISYTWCQFTVAVEIQDSLRNQEITPHGIIAFKQPIGDFSVGLYGGLRPGKLSGALSIDFRNFVHGMLLYENSTRIFIGFNFRPPVKVKEVTVVDTLFVHKKVIVEKPATKKEPEPSPIKPLSKKDRQYCEEHYLKGIEYYVNNQLNEAIAEWKLVAKVYAEYKDVKRYLENAQAKLELLEE